MPVIIKELVINAIVDPNERPAEPAPSSASAVVTADAQQKLVQQCVRQVLAILKEKTER